MSPYKRNLEDEIERRVSMAAQIADKDEEYAFYAGGSFGISSRIAKIDTFLKSGLIPWELIPIVKLYRAYLDQQRKAYLASISSEVTKLGFILGITGETMSAT